jgi:hypothetical protein
MSKMIIITRLVQINEGKIKVGTEFQAEGKHRRDGLDGQLIRVKLLL